MGLFNNRPYKVDDLSGAEDAAISASLEVAIDSGADKAMNGKLSKAYRHYKKGSLSKDDVVVILAAVTASLKTISDRDNSNDSEKAGLAAAALLLALDKLRKKL